ncbi:MAG: DUF1501 domain-containing protein [Hyphomicrobiales bacterium]
MLSRRALLHAAAACGAYSMLPALTLAAAATDHRLVVIVLRGGMDGLDVVQPWGDPEFARLRPKTAQTPPAPGFAAGNYFGLHQSLAPLEPMFKARELSFVHAVSTPYRNRSHFEAQDLLEKGTGTLAAAESGWVNRLIGLIGSNRMEFAADIGTGSALLLKGPAEYLNLYPESDLAFWRNSTQFLRLLYQDDPQLRDSFSRIETASDSEMQGENLDPGVSVREIAGLAAKLLKGDSRIAAYSLYGWDTHFAQGAKLKKSLDELTLSLLTLKDGLGAAWAKTAVVAVSEFGRTARFNGSGGSDHGTGGAAVLAGGLFANGQGGKILTTSWPGLSETHLYEGRDLMPVDDVRRYLGWLVVSLFDLKPATVEASIFPGLTLDSPLKLI